MLHGCWLARECVIYALIRTVRCHAALIEDLTKIDKYEHVLTARLQSHPLERRYGQFDATAEGTFWFPYEKWNLVKNIENKNSPQRKLRLRTLSHFKHRNRGLSGHESYH